MKPRLLDLFCGAGGAGMGYSRAGFDVVGVDIEPQTDYPFEFHQADAMTFDLSGFDAIHASPPCQAYARVTSWRGDQGNHPRLLEPIRLRLAERGVPWVIENVPEAPVRRDFFLCGSMFGLSIRRHRVFETSCVAPRVASAALRCRHRPTDLAFEHKGERAYADAMNCHWMTNVAGREAIPPAYTEHIGGYLMAEVNARARAAA